MLSTLKKYAGIGMRKAQAKTVVTQRPDHCISRRLIDRDALKVMYRLNRADYTAYLVGGGVRDLLLGRTPKDFDVSTDAHPNQIKRLFRNCFLVGRRFRLAHIRFGDKIIETSTFRRQPQPPAAVTQEEPVGMRKRINTFGTPEEDARMRDFTINGLFYDIRTFSVID
ncbi:MAG: polynucleotide adenylyltransferase, partial [Deltaproteobacteria bacterium]|nr:polynucleotide adenylyltransferase [Deltaproteobacteria bacterium]